MTAPALTVEIGFGSNWKTADGSISWTDVTAYVMHGARVSAQRGRSTELDEFRAGTFSLTLRNEDRRFDPSYSAGPHFGDIKPGTPIRIRATPSGLSAAAVIRGFADSWAQEYDRSNRLGVCVLSCTDGFAKLSTAGLPSSVYALEVAADAPVAWYRLAEDAGTVMGDSSGNNHHGTYDDGQTFFSRKHPNRWETESAIDVDSTEVRSATVTEELVTALPLGIEFIAFAHPEPFDTGAAVGNRSIASLYHENPTTGSFGLRWDVDGTSTDVTLTVDFGAGAVVLTGYDALDPSSPHHLFFKCTSGPTSLLYVDGVSVTLTGPTTTGTAFLEQLSSAVADVAVYNTSVSEARIQAHAAAFTAPWDGDSTGTRIGRLLDAVGWPSGLRDLETGDSTLGPAVLDGKALQLCQNVEAAEQGRLFISKAGAVRFLNRYFFVTETTSSTSQATISDDGSDHPYSGFSYSYNTDLVLNRIQGRRPGGALVEVSDSDSIDAYGEQVDERLVGAALGTDAGVRDAALYRLNQYKDPAMRAQPIRIPLHRLTPSQQSTLLALELGYRVTVERTPQGVGSQNATEAIVEHISHDVGNGEWWMTVTTSPIDAAEWFVWGTSEWDDAGARWAY